MPTSPLRAELATQGFTIQRAILGPSELSALREAAARTTARARSGRWPDVRTVGKQFPPWPKPKPDADTDTHVPIWGVQGLLNRDLGPEAAVFARAYFGDAVLGVARELLGADDDGGAGDGKGIGECRDEDLVMELFNMLVRPDTDFELEWHRDDVPRSASVEEECARLGIPLSVLRTEDPSQSQEKGEKRKRDFHTQYNLALYPDSSLIVIPGSHARPRTEAERVPDPYAPALPGQLVVYLEPGDIVFYDNNILHRGVYDCTKERMSLHGSVGHVGGARARARNVLQHGVGGWVDQCDFAALGGGEDGRIRRRAEGMRDRLVKLGRESGDVGFSLTG
ncbi:Uu.00g125430.m01.CDS01 [Anthostomella pinea]|uniref:Uu.00g125430.m01.CDS01 n=1 Tax=Anthostomella pinea TaxID=933095 RepID=A0AAI8VHP1_9PEZI|nr:Uu.00g125430.m01.CDS01 [Anthostomella pinea]